MEVLLVLSALLLVFSLVVFLLNKKITAPVGEVKRSDEWLDAMEELEEIDWWIGIKQDMPMYVRKKYMHRRLVHYEITQVKELPEPRYFTPNEVTGRVPSHLEDCFEVEKLENPYWEYSWMEEPVFRVYLGKAHYIVSGYSYVRPIYSDDRLNKIFWGDRWKTNHVRLVNQGDFVSLFVTVEGTLCHYPLQYQDVIEIMQALDFWSK